MNSCHSDWLVSQSVRLPTNSLNCSSANRYVLHSFAFSLRGRPAGEHDTIQYDLVVVASWVTVAGRAR